MYRIKLNNVSQLYKIQAHQAQSVIDSQDSRIGPDDYRGNWLKSIALHQLFAYLPACT